MHHAVAYWVLDKNFTRLANDCAAESTEQTTTTEEVLPTTEDVGSTDANSTAEMEDGNSTAKPTVVDGSSATSEGPTADQLITTIREVTITDDGEMNGTTLNQKISIIGILS